MNPDRLRGILERVARGDLDPAAAFEQMKRLPFEDLGFAKVDHHRALRCGFPEVIYCRGKTTAQVAGIAREILRQLAGPEALEQSPKFSFVHRRAGEIV